MKLFDVWKRGPDGITRNVGKVTADNHILADNKVRRMYGPGAYAKVPAKEDA